MTQANWSDDRVEQLKNLWTEGLSASQIARALGGVTRNAVIGKVHRLGLAGRASPARADRPAPAGAPKASTLRNAMPAAPVVGGRSAAARRRQFRHRADHQRPHVPLADRRSRRHRIPLLRPQPEIRFALLRGPCPQGLPAAAAAPARSKRAG